MPAAALAAAVRRREVREGAGGGWREEEGVEGRALPPWEGVGGGRIRRRASRRCHGRARDEGGGRGGGPAQPPWEGAGGGRGMGRRVAP